MLVMLPTEIFYGKDKMKSFCLLLMTSQVYVFAYFMMDDLDNVLFLEFHHYSVKSIIKELNIYVYGNCLSPK